MSMDFRHDRVNVDAFGPTQVRGAWGVDMVQSGTDTTFPGSPGTARSPNDFRLGETPAGESAVTLTLTPSLPAILGGYAAMAVGGGLTGYLASGTQRGAIIGALVHSTLFSFGTALAGRGRLSTPYLVGFATLGLAAASGAGWLFMKRKR